MRFLFIRPTKLQCLTCSSNVNLDRAKVSYTVCFSAMHLYKAQIICDKLWFLKLLKELTHLLN